MVNHIILIAGIQVSVLFRKECVQDKEAGGFPKIFGLNLA
jgi:hypothetical protein